MRRYKLTARARRQIADVFRYGVETFGFYQAEAYHAGLERTFGLLADFPHMARFQAHFIIYSEEAGHILIRAVAHHAQNWRRNAIR